MDESGEKYLNIPLADRVEGILQWRESCDAVNVTSFRSTYYTFKYPERFFEQNSILYVREISTVYVRRLIDASVKIAGSLYALALVLSGGDRSPKALQPHYYNIKSKNLSKYSTKKSLLKPLEKFIKANALACGVYDEKVKWAPTLYHDMKIETLKRYYHDDKSQFIVIDSVVYYLLSQKTILEKLFFKCVEIAGGEHALALATANDDRKLMQKHIKAFERLSFTQRNSSSYYAAIFEKFLQKNQQLFDNRVEI